MARPSYGLLMARVGDVLRALADPLILTRTRKPTLNKYD
jgi:hypothetical protein